MDRTVIVTEAGKPCGCPVEPLEAWVVRHAPDCQFSPPDSPVVAITAAKEADLIAALTSLRRENQALRLAHPVLDRSAAIERAAQAIAFVSWGERGKEFIAPEYSTHTDGQNSVREHTYKQAEAVVDAILGGTQQKGERA